MQQRILFRWRWFWTRYAGPFGFGKVASRLAALGTVPYHGRQFLALIHSHGYIAPTAGFAHTKIRLGANVYVGDGVYAFDEGGGSVVELQDRVCLYGDTIIHTGRGGGISVGPGTHIQPKCFIAAYVSDIRIGGSVEIAPCCSFYSFNHGVVLGTVIMAQSLTSKGPITIGDGAWLGQGVIVQSGVRIGEGAVVGSGSVVTRDIPDNVIAVGAPARVIKHRKEVSALRSIQ